MQHGVSRYVAGKLEVEIIPGTLLWKSQQLVYVQSQRQVFRRLKSVQVKQSLKQLTLFRGERSALKNTPFKCRTQ